MYKKYLVPLNIQLFADDPQDNPDNPEIIDTTEPNINPEVKTFTQEEIDKIIKGRLAKERKNWEKELNAQKTEAEKLASMTEKEKNDYQEQKRIDDLNKREAELVKRELMATAKETLTEKELPHELSSLLDYSDAEKCKASIENVESVFKNALQEAVNKALKGSKTLKKAPEKEKISEKEQLLKDSTDMTLPLSQRVAAKNKLLTIRED